MAKLRFINLEEARNYFRTLGIEYYGAILLKKGIDVKSLYELSVEQLKDIRNKVFEISGNRMYIGNKTYDFYKLHDFEIEDKSKVRVLYPYHMRNYLEEVIEIVSERINYLEQTEKVSTIKKLVKELPENAVKEKLSIEIKELEAKKEELEQSRLIEKERIQEELEFAKHRTEILEKKYDIFLKFLNRESVASIVGSILLLLMGICLLVRMFLRYEPIKIVESAFLLILGYFFGHSKNNK